MLSVFARDLDQTFGLWRTLPQAPGDQVETLLDYDQDETEDQYQLTFDVPGVAKDDLQLEVIGNRLTVAGERKSRRPTKFHRVFTLPEGVTAEHVGADLRDGVLTLKIKKPAAAKPSRITIGDGATERQRLAKAN